MSPQAEVKFRGIPDREDWWVCIVLVGGVILVESSAGPLSNVLDDVTKKLKGMSQRMVAVLDQNNGNGTPSVPPPPSSR